jgi:phosphopantothenoylcysteine decarboxylase/phosphopantothenate--cysteine ligase
VSGPTSLTPPLGVKAYHIRTANEMREAVLREYEKVDVVIKAAAVSDYRPKQFIPYKVKKTEDVQTVELVRNPDILAELGQGRGNASWSALPPKPRTYRAMLRKRSGPSTWI